MPKYDYIIAGGGCAGLSLAYQISRSKLRNKKVLIIDKSVKNTNDRTWSFWHQEATHFDHLFYRQWQQIRFINQEYNEVHELKDWRYSMLRGIDFYEYIYEELAQNPNIDKLYATIEELGEEDERVFVQTNEGRYEGDWLFNSCFKDEALAKEPTRYHYLLQHFLGWVIEVEEDIFTPDCPTMFDFRTQQAEEVRFLYTLPFSKNKALVEYTIFGRELYTQDFYEKELKQYLEAVLKLKSYKIHEVEKGCIPMYDHPFETFPSPRTVHIGTLGGRAKPSTGYAFLRIQEQSRQLVKALLETGKPQYTIQDYSRYQYYDTLLLNILRDKGDRISDIFTEMFKNNPIQRIFRFLDASASPYDDFRIMWSVPWQPFLEAIWKTRKQRSRVETQ